MCGEVLFINFKNQRLTVLAVNLGQFSAAKDLVSRGFYVQFGLNLLVLVASLYSA